MNAGIYEATILKTTLSSTQGGTPYVAMRVQPNDGGIPLDEITAKIWLTDKAMNMARAQLKKCGFDPDARDLSEFQSNPTILAGRSVTIEISEDEKYGPQASVVLGGISNKKLDSLTQALRAAKKPDEPEVSEQPAGAAVAPSGEEIPF